MKKRIFCIVMCLILSVILVSIGNNFLLHNRENKFEEHTIFASNNGGNAVGTSENYRFELWNRTFFKEGKSEGYSVQQTTDGGYIIVGYTTTINIDVWLIKTNANGVEQWNKTFGGSRDDVGRMVQQTTDGGYIIVGLTYSFGINGDVWLIKTDANGVEQWNKTYGGPLADEGYAGEQTSDGGYIITGWKNYSNGISKMKGWLIKTDANGNKTWDKTFSETGSNALTAIQQTTDGGYILSGWATGTGTYANLWLVKTDSSGTKLWEKTFGQTRTDMKNAVQQTTDGGYIITGSLVKNSVFSDVVLIKTDANGNSIWSKTFGGTGDDAGTTIQQTIDGGYIIIGFTDSFGTNPMDAWLIKTDINGKEQWNKTFDQLGNEAGYGGEQTTDGGYIMTGGTCVINTIDCGIFLMKTNGPPQTPTIPSGPSSLSIGENGTYTTTTIDPQGDQVWYQWKFGLETTNWIGPYSSGSIVQQNHSWATAGVYNVSVKAKDQYFESNWSTPLVVTIMGQPQKELVVIVNPIIVLEGKEFVVTVTLDQNPVAGAQVEFSGSIRTTDSSGETTFTTLQVSRDTTYRITASYDNYKSATTTITVLNQKELEGKNGWIYGIVRDHSGNSIEGATVCIHRSTSSMIDCMYTTEDGRYLRYLPIGVYTIEVSKPGYTTKIKSDLQVTENAAIGTIFVLEQEQIPAIVNQVTGYIDYTIQQKGSEGTIGAQITIDHPEKPTTLYYSPNFTIELNSTDTTVSFTVSADNGTNGTIFVVRIGEGVLSDLDHVNVTFDGRLINEISNIKTFFDVKNNTNSSWLRVLTTTGLYLFVRVPHFSTHTITISSVAEFVSGTTAVILYIVFIVIIAIIYAVPIWFAQKK